jgi:hypothetical protein
MARRQFNTMLTEAISLQHVRYFQRQFGHDIISRVLTLKQFCELIQVIPVLGNDLFHTVLLKDVKLIFRTTSSQHIRTAECYRNQPNSRSVGSSHRSPFVDVK